MADGFLQVEKVARPPETLVDWGFSCGRANLTVAGHVVAVEGDPCRDMVIRERFWTPEAIKLVGEKARAALGVPAGQTPDDAIEVTHDWLLSEGFYQTTILGRLELWNSVAYRAVMVFCGERQRIGICADPVGSAVCFLEGKTTRGDVRRLRALLMRRAQ